MVCLGCSCDTGFGNKLALVLAEKGFSVYAGCLTDASVKAMNAVTGITALKMDVTKQADIDAVVERINKDHPNGLWAVVNNAGTPSQSLREGGHGGGSSPSRVMRAPSHLDTSLLMMSPPLRCGHWLHPRLGHH